MTPPESGATPGSSHPSDLDAETARAWIGGKLDDLHGDAVGRVDGVLVDALDGHPTWLVVRLGRFGRRTAVPAEFAAAGVGRVWVPLRREAIRSAPPVEAGTELSGELERELAAHFALPVDTGRIAGLAERGEGEPGSVPAS